MVSHWVSARGAWLRASNYHRTAGLFLFGPDPRFAATVRRQATAFARATALFDTPAEHLRIPPGVDPSRIVLQGWSFGGYHAPRAATAEHRLAACISDSGPYDLRAATLDRVPRALAAPFSNGAGWATDVLRRLMRVLLSKPTAGWGLRRGLFAHGLDGCRPRWTWRWRRFIDSTAVDRATRPKLRSRPEYRRHAEVVS